ncbi:hypothetical protein SELMODRAFT_164833 [Selaginella moellendorffii]|uniref:Uncharacterized protein n=1 Tax=Selaginella moellendorffii TaxID=88036 RepID=D8QRL7_SELML|nr:hypothetical protein SELMODRAFT_164833 [Selaginella moellendorffii]
MGTSLPPKEANLFKLIVKSYETKQYKKGLKAADQILKKFPEHGETLAMKGLTLNCMDRKTEAYELVRKGLKNDVKSHVCWHVYGLLYRSDREYREAIKCYRNALRIDPENKPIQILRDLSLLQVQMRDLDGFVETRRQLLTLKPNHRNNWICFAIAQHLNSRADIAVEILQAYEGTLEEDFPPDNERYEHSEMLLYKVSLLEESGALEKALEELRNKQAKIVDKLGVKEVTAGLLLKLNRFEEAEKGYRNLIEICPDNTTYHESLQKCIGISQHDARTEEDTAKLVLLYDDLRTKHPDSAVAKRMPLDFLEGDSFRRALDKYIRPFLRKGVPSLFSALRPLYSSSSRAIILEEVILEFEDSLRKTGCFPSSTEKEPPSAFMWILYLLAQHFDRKRDVERAVEKIDEAIKHTPTAIDLYLVKGRILKHAGDPVAAASLADEARTMDLADRFVNSECVKRMLQADQVELAEKTAALFTKDGDQHNNLYDMQCMWYELASGDSHFRQGALGKALKKFVAVEKHYNDMTEDQFDFHTYCLRKMTLRAYVHMLRFQDRLHSFPFFYRAACSAIRCYLCIYDSPPKTAVEEEAVNAGLTPSERKKLRQKSRKAEARAKKEAEKAKEEEKASNASKGAKKGTQAPKPFDNDPDGEQLVHVEDPLGEALKYLKLLQMHSPDSLETHLLAFEIYMRRQKVLLAFQAIKRLIRVNSDHPDIHHCLCRFYNMVDNKPEPDSTDKLVWEVVAAERSLLRDFGNRTLLEINKDFLDCHTDSLLHRVVAAEVLQLLSPGEKDASVKIVLDSRGFSSQTFRFCSGEEKWELKQCMTVHKKLQSVLDDPDAAERWRARCAQLFPYSTYFKGLKSSSMTGSAESGTVAVDRGIDTHDAVNSTS